MRIRHLATAVVAAVSITTLTGCDDAGSSTNTDNSLVVGIYYDHPGWGLKGSDGGFSGFDVDMARYLARGLGYADSELKFKMVTAADRISDLQDGSVDMVLADLAYTPDRAQQIAMAGPYFVAGQDILTAKDNRTITGPHSLDGDTLCTATGTTTADDVKTLSPGVNLEQLPSLTDCVAGVLNGSVDAVTSDDAILAGYVQQYPRQLKVLGAPFSTDYYTVGLPLGSTQVDQVNTLIQQAYDDGSWQAIFEKNLKFGGVADVKPEIGQFA